MLLLSRFSHETPRTTVHQAPLFLGFSGQEYWSGLPFPSPYSLAILLLGIFLKNTKALILKDICIPSMVILSLFTTAKL